MTGVITHRADGPPAATLGDAERLVYPLTTVRFLADYWQQRPVHLTGWADRFPDLFDRARLRRVLAVADRHDLSVRVSGDHEGDGGGAAAHVLVDPSDVADRLSEGTSLCVDPVDRADAQVAALADDLRVGLGHPGPVSVKCYLSTTGFGFNTHFDAQVVTTVQLEGSKRWRVSRLPGVPFPVDNAFLDATATIRYNGRTPSSIRVWERPPVVEDDFVEVTLEPGDVLCLPAGTWHAAKASGGPSLALNFSFSPVDTAAVLLELVRAELEESESWRAGLPAGEPVGVALAARATELASFLTRLDLEAPAAARRGAELAAGIGLTGSGPTRPAATAHAAAAAASATWAGRRVQCVLGVADAGRAADWYGKVLGSRVVSAIPEFGWVEVSTGVAGLTLGLTEVPTSVSNRGAVIDFEVDDLERIREVLRANGVPVDAPATEIAGMATVLSARDLDGNSLMFFEPWERSA